MPAVATLPMGQWGMTSTDTSMASATGPLRSGASYGARGRATELSCTSTCTPRCTKPSSTPSSSGTQPGCWMPAAAQEWPRPWPPSAAPPSPGWTPPRRSSPWPASASPGRLPGWRAGGAAVPCPLVHGGDLVQRRPVRRQPHRHPGARGATGRHPGRLGGDQYLRPAPRLRDARGVRGPTAAAATPTPGAPAARSGCRSRAGWRRWFNRPGSPRSTRPRWPARSTIPTARRLGGRCPQRGRSWPPSEAPAGRGCGRRSRPRWPLPDQRWRRAAGAQLPVLAGPGLRPPRRRRCSTGVSPGLGSQVAMRAGGRAGPPS